MEASSDNRPVGLVPIDSWNQYYPWPTPSGLRHLAFYSETNGFKTAFVKVGRRRLVDDAEFFRCARKQGQEK